MCIFFSVLFNCLQWVQKDHLTRNAGYFSKCIHFLKGMTPRENSKGENRQTDYHSLRMGYMYTTLRRFGPNIVKCIIVGTT